MSVVVDLGCAPQHGHDGIEDSIGPLIERFDPDAFYGFDPAEGDWFDAAEREIEGVLYAELHRKAAWLYDGRVGFRHKGIRGRVAPRVRETPVACFDFPAWLGKQPEPVIVKLDVEGAEYALLAHVITRGCASKLERVLVEWHRGGPVGTRAWILERLECPVEDWHA